jgi:hypothetical protein
LRLGSRPCCFTRSDSALGSSRWLCLGAPVRRSGLVTGGSWGQVTGTRALFGDLRDVRRCSCPRLGTNSDPGLCCVAIRKSRVVSRARIMAAAGG